MLAIRREHSVPLAGASIDEIATKCLIRVDPARFTGLKERAKELL